MADEQKLRQQQSRGERAKLILEDELVIEAFEKIEAEIDKAWKTSDADDEKGRYNAYLMYRLLQNFRGEFKRAVSTGAVASKELFRMKDPMFGRKTNG